jgi:hypothetical protein
MKEVHGKLPAKQTLWLVLLPMVATFVCQRLYLHFVGIRHIFPGGYLVHHLFIGITIELPAAFILAFGTRNHSLGLLAPVALGVGSAMILDEVTYLFVTNATDKDYVSRVSVFGAIGMISLAAIVLFALYWFHRE